MSDAGSPDTTALAAGFAAVPFNRMAGFRLLQATPERAEIALDPGPDLLQEHGVVHGGMLAALADTAAVYLVHPFLDEGERMASIEFKVNFLAAARPEGGELRAVAVPVKVGRRVAVCRAEVTQGGRRVVEGLFTYLRFVPSEG